MTAIIVTALLIGYAVWLAEKFLPILDRKWKAEAENNARYTVLEERRLTTDERKGNLPADRTPMPADLLARINAWEDEFAREDERKFVEQLYAESGNWDAVRRAYAPPLADNQPVAE